MAGTLAEALHLAGTAVEREELLRAFDGQEPGTGNRLIGYWRPDRVAAHDLVFSAPSSVTVLWALGDDGLRAAIQRAQDQAVAEAFRYVESQLELVRRLDGETPLAELRHQLGRDPLPSERRGLKPRTVQERAAALLGAAFSHHTSRQTRTQAREIVPPDPQLHTHVLLLSMAQRQDGQIVAINSLELHRRRSEVGAVYRAALASRLQALGFHIDRCSGKDGRYFEVAGVPLSLRTYWSSRHQEINTEERRQELREVLGREPTKVELHQAAARTRVAKSRWWRGDLFHWWRDVAASLGVTPATLERLRRGGDQGLPAAQRRARLVAELLSEQGLTRQYATFDLTTLRREAYERAPGLASADQVEQALQELLAHEHVVEVQPGVWTTREMLELERTVLAWKAGRTPSRVDAAVQAWQQRRAGTASVVGRPPVPNPRTVEEALLRCPVRLSEEQRQAVTEVLATAFVALTGEAGVGKGVVLRVASDVWRRQHRRVLAVAVGGAQAQRLAADLGPGTEALTLDALTWRVQHGRLQLGSSDVVVLDEAGQVDTRRWAALARATGQQPTVVAVGDAAQLSAITAGGLWPMLAAGGPRLTEVRRTRLEWEREAWGHLRRGESAEALSLYARRHCLELHETRSQALDAAVRAWDAEGRDGLIVTDASNAERHRANAAAQAARLHRGELGNEGVTNQTPQGEVVLRTGDPVIFTGQYRHSDLSRRVENGTTGEVVAVNPARGTIRVRTNEASVREIEIAVSTASPLDLHYAAHVYKAQGTTVRHAYIVAGGWQTHREGLYVACSRSREGSRLFVDRESLGADADLDALAELVTRAQESRAKVAASDVDALSQREKRRYRGGGRRPSHREPLSIRQRSHLAAIGRALWQQARTLAMQTPAVTGSGRVGAGE